MSKTATPKHAFNRQNISAWAGLAGALLTLIPILSMADVRTLDWSTAPMGPGQINWPPPLTNPPNPELMATYSVFGGTVTVSVTGSNGSEVYLGNPLDPAVVSPVVNMRNTGGLLTDAEGLFIATNYPDRATLPDSDRQVVVTLDFSGFPAGGVSDVVINMFDIDAAGAFHDEVTVTANTGNPTSLLTGTQNDNPFNNTVSGIPGVGAPSNSPDGNGTFDFSGQSGITRIRIVYKNVIGLDDPGFQSISLHNVFFDDRVPLSVEVAEETETTIVGKVFNDLNGDGWQDPGEDGVPGVRLGTTEGLIVETDQHGRYHLAGIDGGLMERGRNFILKADPASLPRGTKFTTENPRVKRITRGLMNRFDFGVRLPGDTACCQVELKLSEIFFDENSDVVRDSYLRVLKQFAARLRAQGGGVVTIEGLAGESEPARPRIKAQEELLVVKDYTLKLNFEDREYTLNDGARKNLNRIVSEWNGVENIQVKVVGHTSLPQIRTENRTPEVPDNRALSTARAKIVADYLRKALRLNRDAVMSKGVGSNEMLIPGDSTDANRANRRVELTMTGHSRVLRDASVPGAAAIRVDNSVYNRDLAERRAVRVYLTLKSLLGEELVRDVDFRVQRTAVETAPEYSAQACTEEACVSDQGYAFTIVSHETAPQPAPDSSRYAAKNNQRADVRGEFIVSLANGGALWATEDPTQVEPRLAVGGPEALPLTDGKLSAEASFYIYNNYATFMQSAELVFYRSDDVDRIEPLARLDVPRVNYTRVTLPAIAGQYRDGDVLYYLMRAYDGTGSVDETQTYEIVLREMVTESVPVTEPMERTESQIPYGKIAASGTSPLNGNVLVFLPGSETERRESQEYTLTPRFDSRKTYLSQNDKNELNSIADQWRGATGIRIQAIGHTDNVPIAKQHRGEFANNQVLSEARAMSVANYVAGALGVAGNSVVALGRAASEPVDTNKTAQGRANNRRVELSISSERLTKIQGPGAVVRLVNPETGGEEAVEFSIDEAENVLAVKYDVDSALAEPDAFEKLMNEAERQRNPAPKVVMHGAFSAQKSADALQQVYGRNDLVQQNILVQGSRVRLHGRDIGKNLGLRVDGASLPLDTAGYFAVEYLLPVGKRQFNVEFIDEQGLVTTPKPVSIDVTGESMYIVAMVDLTLSDNDLSGSVESLSADDRYLEDFLTEGRIAFYLKGKIKGKYLVTAQLDTQEEQLDNIFDRIDNKDPRSVFRRLDPDRYYPVYGDDSTTISDTDSQGRLYVRAQWDKSEARWGNYHTGITGTEFAQYNRSLYGGRYHHRSIETTQRGDARLEGIVFLSETQAAFGHTEFLGTGGSLYYLKHRDVLPGSEKVSVEVRDRDSGRVLENKALVRGLDYEIDEFQGRLILARPLPQISELVTPSLIMDTPLDGDRLVLLADYEYVPDGFSADKVTVGGRGKYWLNDSIAVGATYIDENRGNNDYQLGGFDVTLQSGRGTYIKAEIADTENTQVSGFFSDNGGLDFTSLNDMAATGRSGDAVSIEGRANLREWLGSDNDWIIGAWWRDTDKDFSIARRDIGVATTDYGIEANGHIGERLKLGTRLSVVERDLAGENRAFSVQADYQLTERGSIAAEVRQVEEELPGGQTDDGTLGALRYTHRVRPNLDVWGTAQITLDNGGSYLDNDRFSAGARLRWRDDTSMAVEFGDGDRGSGGSLTLDHEINSMHRVYGTYTHSTDRTDPLSRQQFAVGHRSQISNQTALFNEMQFLEHDQQSGIGHVFGLDFTPRRGWNIGLTAQTGSLEGPRGTTERDATTIATGFHNDDLRWVSKLEYRNDNGASDRRQWLMSNRVDLKVSDASTLLGRVNVSDTVDQSNAQGNAKFVESSIGYAYRPVEHDRWNVLTKYTYLYDLPGLDQVDTNRDQRSHIVSVEGIYRLNRRWDLGGKLARRESDLRTARDEGNWIQSSAVFAALRGRYHMLRAWDGLVEYRLFDVDESETGKRGFLIALERHFGDHLKLGLGYNFTDFSDDLGNLDYDHKGFFLNALGKY